MNPTELKKSAIENNIKVIQKRIQELEQSFDSVNHEDSAYEEPINNNFQQILQREQILQEASFSKANTRNHNDDRSRSNNKRYPHRVRQEDEISQQGENYENRKMLEGLLREIDILRENEKQADVKIETLTFRCEKLQNELTVKLDVNNKLMVENDDKNSQIKSLLAQIKSLEGVIDQNKRTFVPEFQRIRSQYDIAVLEIRSLENDNSILENRIQDLTEMNTQIRDDKREVDSKNRQIEIERLTLKKEIEELRANFMNHENEYEDLNDKFEKLILENERLKNEISYLNQRNKIQVPEVEIVEESFANYDLPKNAKHDFMNNFDKKREVKRTNDLMYLDQKAESEKRSSWQFERKDKADNQNFGSKLITTNNDRLNFDQLAQIEEKLKKMNNK